MSGIKAVLFDQDGLMFDTERVSAASWIRAAGELGFEMNEEILQHFRGRWPEESAAYYGAHIGPVADYWKMRNIKQKYYYETLERDGLPVKKGLQELLAWLDDHGYQMALTTASPRDWSLNNLKIAGVSRYFHVCVCGDMVTRCKPDPEIFQTAAGQLGRKPEECLVLEDSIQGVQAALNGGFPVIMVPDITQPDQELIQKLTAKCDSLLEVRTWFEENGCRRDGPARE